MVLKSIYLYLWFIVFLGLSHHAFSAPVKFRFLDEREAAQFLTNQDSYMTAMQSSADANFRMGYRPNTRLGKDQLLRRVTEAARSWSDAEKQVTLQAIARFQQAVAKLRKTIRLPAEIFLIVTNGAEDLGAAYTRENAIVFHGMPIREEERESRDTLLAHEFFHIISRYNPELRKTAYRIVGFKLIDKPLQFPTSLRNIIFTNPDALYSNHYIEVVLTATGESIAVMPMLYFQKKFEEIDFLKRNFEDVPTGLIEIEIDENEYRVKVDEKGNPVIHAIADTNYENLVNANTTYIDHPEEIAASECEVAVAPPSALQIKNPRLLRDIEGILFRAGKKAI